MGINLSSSTSQLDYEQYVTRAAKICDRVATMCSRAATGTGAVKLLGYELATDKKLHALLRFLST